ncbi:beta-N-acetylhexosaminidase [Aestuariibacter halophilus]|uniref:Beta-hexosaminidase n=1 Tax=Fluctibacter halophilus TaxID=226011 RepID=A0ABS8G707_9ALTE|nr:beta-N-acetylhexosaminidase [Aestuariibacter halophilus]MCC2615881.1 beta-N-acetylhexosaminidase [Aestuariibacter halophilus]
MMDVSAELLSADEKDMLDHPSVGGIILFTRNYHDQQQLRELVRSIREASRNDVLIAVDHEGGRVQRFREGFSAIPAMGSLYSRAAGDLDVASQYASTFGWLMAAELLAFDIDISFAPVLDIHGVSDVIGDRSFHQQPEVIVQLASQFIKGMHKAGMKATGKHFPGHGNVKEDSHFALPVDQRSEGEIFQYDMRIFAEIHQQGLLDAVMPAHVVYPAVDKLPAGFSKVWIRDILRKRLDFDGVVFSDDLSMQGAVHVGGYAQRAELALDAGCDMVLVCNDQAGAVQVMDGLPKGFEASDRLLRLRKQPSQTDFAGLTNSYAHKAACEQLSAFNQQSAEQ